MGEALALCSGSRVRHSGDKQGEVICLFHNDSDCTGLIKKTVHRAEPRETRSGRDPGHRLQGADSEPNIHICLGELKLLLHISPTKSASSEVDKIISNIMQEVLRINFNFFIAQRLKLGRRIFEF